MIIFVDYASPSTFNSTRDESDLSIAANARRPVRLHGAVAKQHGFLFRVALRALGRTITHQRGGGHPTHIATVGRTTAIEERDSICHPSVIATYHLRSRSIAMAVSWEGGSDSNARHRRRYIRVGLSPG